MGKKTVPMDYAELCNVLCAMRKRNGWILSNWDDRNIIEFCTNAVLILYN